MHKLINKACGGVCALGLGLALIGIAPATESGAASGQTYTVKWAIGQAETGVASDMVRSAAFTIEHKTKGAVKIEIFYSGQLGSNTAVMTQLIHGVAQVFTQDTNTMSKVWPTATFTNLPYLFTSPTQAYAYWTSKPGKQELAAIRSRMGIRMLGAGGFGFHSVLSSTGPITGLTSFKGLKACSPSSSAVNLFLTAVGAQEVVATTIPDEYTKLEEGICQAILMGPSSLVANKFTEQAKHFTFSRTSFQYAATWMNDQFFQGLPAKFQKIFSAAVTKAVKKERAQIQDTTRKTGTYAEQMRGNGVSLNDLPSSGRQEIAKAVKSKVYSQVGKVVGPTAAKWLREWEAVKSKTSAKTSAKTK